MKNFSTWMIVMFCIMFWAVRLIATFTSSVGIEFIIKPMDFKLEIPLLFISFLCICFVMKRRVIPAIIYLIAHGAYYGVYLYDNINNIMTNQLQIDNALEVSSSFIGIILPILALLDLLYEKNKSSHYKDKKTDWFYADEKFDRKLDSRADKNNYRTLQ